MKELKEFTCFRRIDHLLDSTQLFQRRLASSELGMSFVVVDVIVATSVFQLFGGPDGSAADARPEVLKKLEEFHFRAVDDLSDVADGGVVMLVEGLGRLPARHILMYKGSKKKKIWK